MAKFYIQCGSLEFLTTADDGRTASLWAIDQYFSRLVDLDSVGWTNAAVDPNGCFAFAWQLDKWLTVSECGFGLDDAGRFDIADLLAEWQSLRVAVARLEAEILSKTV